MSQDEGDDGDVSQHSTEAEFGKIPKKLQILYLQSLSDLLWM